MSGKELQVMEAMTDQQRRFFDLWLDPTAPGFLDVDKTGLAVYGSAEAAHVMLSSPVGRAWRDLYLRRNEGGVADLLTGIATGRVNARQTKTMYEYDEDGRMVPRAAVVTERQASPTERMKAMKLMQELGVAVDNIERRVQPERDWEELLA